MRSLVIVLLLAASTALHAQEQERKMMDRILQPDMTLGNPMQNKAFGNSGAGGADFSKEASVKDFNFTQKFTPKAFDTKQFDAKNFWKGDFQFSTKAADVKADRDAGKSFATKGLPVKDASEAGKTFANIGSTFSTQGSPIKGKTSQQHLDDMYKGKEKEMNIDQIRDLLNKPKL